jgi:DNA-directed RNA polymerase subunit F
MSGNRTAPHWKAAIAVSLLAFASGVVVGVAGTLHHVSTHLQQFLENPEKMPERIVGHLRGELGLSDEQAKQVLDIFERSHERLRSIRKEVEPRIDVIVQATFDEVSRTLRPEQQPAWRDWFDRMKRKFTLHDQSGNAPAKPAP